MVSCMSSPWLALPGTLPGQIMKLPKMKPDQLIAAIDYSFNKAYIGTVEWEDWKYPEVCEEICTQADWTVHDIATKETGRNLQNKRHT